MNERKVNARYNGWDQFPITISYEDDLSTGATDISITQAEKLIELIKEAIQEARTEMNDEIC